MFAIDIDTCQRCGGNLNVIASIEAPELIANILAHLDQRNHEGNEERRGPAHTRVVHGLRHKAPSAQHHERDGTFESPILFIDGRVGNDFIEGGAGDDFLMGGSGEDTFFFAPGFGHDTIDDFRPSSDAIALSSELFADYDALLAADALEVVGDDVVIAADTDNTITLTDLSLASLQADDFRFV